MNRPKRVLLILPAEQTFGTAILTGVGAYLATHSRWKVTVPGLRGWPAQVDPATWEGEGVICQITDADQWAMYQRRGMPVVNITAYPGPITVSNDNDAIARLAADHLLARGFRRFAYFGYEHLIYARQRAEAFADYLAEKGCRCSVFLESAEAGQHDDAEVARMVEALGDLPGPLAVMGSEDITARQVLEAARRLERPVPDDIAVIGVDDERGNDLMDPPLSSVEPDGERVGFEAAARLDRLMAGESVDDSPLHIPPRGVAQRRSTDTLAFDDPPVARALEFIRGQPHAAMNVDRIAAAVGLSRRTLERRFRDHLGHSPFQEIRRVQLDHVKRLLTETEWPIKTIAGRSAFKTPHRLMLVFRQEVGCAPTVYRQRHRESGTA